MKVERQPGIYVEITIHAPLDRIWELTQTPHLHQRWDLRFTQIDYLPRPDSSQPQRFRYETRIGFGLRIRGTGESTGIRTLSSGEATSSLTFASDDPKSLIRQGSGYWRYVPVPGAVRFFTWYDYTVRFGPLGRLVDRLAFRPLMGWATAWSFDRLRIWAETGNPPESSLTCAAVHALARTTVAVIWIWHGLVPKLLFRHRDERAMLRDARLSPRWLPAMGLAEIGFGTLLLLRWTARPLLAASTALMLPATATVARRSPRFLRAAFNPVTLNLAVAALGVIGWLASRRTPSAARCLRTPPRPLPHSTARNSA